MEELKQQIDLTRLPQHIAIIMDGNGRWAKERGKQRLFGHQSAIQSVREVSEACAELGVSYLTLYAFSTENWNRPVAEVSGLMTLLAQTIKSETATLNKNNIRLNAIGDLKCDMIIGNGDFVLRLIDKADDLLRTLLEDPAFVGQLDLPAAADEQLFAELRFQIFQLARQGRLAQVQSVRSTCEAFFSCYCQKVLQHSQFHRFHLVIIIPHLSMPVKHNIIFDISICNSIGRAV